LHFLVQLKNKIAKVKIITIFVLILFIVRFYLISNNGGISTPFFYDV